MQLSKHNNQSNYIHILKHNITCHDHDVNDESILFEIDSIHISHVFSITSQPCLFKRGC